MKSLLAVVGTVVLLGLAVVGSSARQFSGQSALTPEIPGWTDVGTVEARVLASSNWNELVSDGKESDAIYGDIVLRNNRIKAVIAQPTATRNANMTVRDVAGAVIDLTSSSAPDDQLAAFYPGKKRFAYRKVTFRDATRMEIPPTAEGISGKSVSVALIAEQTEANPEAIVVYTLNADSPFITVQTTFHNRGSKELTVPLEDDFRADGGKEEMFRSPNAATDRFWLYDRYWGQAYGLSAGGRQMLISSDTRTSSIKYEANPAETQIALAAGASYQLNRTLYSGETVFHVAEQSRRLLHQGYAPLVGTRLEFTNMTGEPSDYRLDLITGENQAGSVRATSRDGMTLPLEPGKYTAKLFYCGQPVGEAQTFAVEANQAQVAINANARTGLLQARITDAIGDPIPCKVDLKPLAEGSKLDFGPETTDFTVRNLIYTPNGRIEKVIPAGRYGVTISRGPEYDAIFTEIDVADGKTAELKGKLIRTVETPGWISAEYHSHSTPSGDNSSSQLGRVVNLVCEHLEFAPCTEHNRISTYQPHIDRLGIGQFISTVSGIELTGSPLPLNHQNAFPMQWMPRTQDGGGPVTGPDLETQIERLALWNNRSEKLIQVNHPDPGWMFYDKNGDGQQDEGHARAFPFMDVIELHDVDNALKLGPMGTREANPYHNRMFNWLQLLNQGYRIYGVVNTDAHYNYHGSGWLRNWIQSSTDDPSKIDHIEMVHASEQGRIIMSNGPYLEVTAVETGKTDSVVSGQDLKVSSGKVTLKVRVQCPNWLDVDTLFVLVNGRKHAVHDYTREKNPDLFRGGVVKFERALDLELKSDAHLVVVTGDVGGNLFQIYGPTATKAQPTALSNPIFIDVNGNGFEPNKDTLDHPLPVKHPNSK